MPLFKLHRLITFSCLLFSSYSINALEIIFINPGFSNSTEANSNKTGDFWFHVSKIMQNAATDLDVTLTIKYANRNHILMKELIQQAINDKPDYLLLVNEKNVTSKYLSKIDSNNVPIYFLLNRPSPASLDMLRENGTNIVGSVTPNNRVAGKLLMQQLYKKFTYKTTTSAHILALLGDYATPASIMRTQGLMDFLTQTPQVTLTAKEVANWSEQEGFTKTLAYVQQAPEINIIWCANDAIAFGAKRALKQLNIQSQVIVGGINWEVPPNTSSELDVSIGGHVLLGAHAIINLFDNHTDLKRWPLFHSTNDIFQPLNDTNKPLYNAINANNLAEIDFSQFSKTRPDKVEFTIENLLLALE
ncbi:sugar ABC transporter substrate-binding protein [Pseudoalteromonas sp. S3260]|uniref:ABC transporter substrate-binding protein n=1 Tax=Pseudoalteromonas sp. S3260 TaxID=579534 RepID=UPI00110A8ACB|nr:ABC transporter substrate-binding protein [Pseudoalteromonas sp. S3260]TMO97327.1 sugar ABC transporter substrate-binding protein [Pseudoalteromonas sp. S3260]